MAIDPRILELCEKVTAKRPRTVIDYIIKNGSVSTEELQTLGYDHPPRAAMDVRDCGIPLETFKVKSERTGRMIGAYRFADPSKIKGGRIDGRRAFSKAFKEALVERYGSRDCISGERLEPRYLQIDHRVPYAVAGDEANGENNVEEFMLLDGSNQRAKSWSCENCKNALEQLDEKTCRSCYWAFPENYMHVAMQPIRRADIIWLGDETAAFDRLKSVADQRKISVTALIKELTSKK